jgi:hypothetical protein
MGDPLRATRWKQGHNCSVGNEGRMREPDFCLQCPRACRHQPAHEKPGGFLFEGSLRCAAGLVARRWACGFADHHFRVDQETAALHLSPFVGWNESFERQVPNLLPGDIDCGKRRKGIPR